MKSINDTVLNKSFYIESLGCSKNQVDSEAIGASLINDGWTWVDNIEESSLIIVNTCGFIEGAKKEAVDVLFDIRNQYPDKKVIAAGCLVQRYQFDLAKGMEQIDGFYGARSPEQIIDLLNSKEEHPVLAPEVKFPTLSRKKLLSNKGSAYVKISEGCSHDCAFCAIPLIKGKLISRPLSHIVEEIRELLDNDIFEIILVSQDTAGYGSDRGELELVKLLKEILKIDKDFWLRLLYLHPDVISGDLISLMEEDSRLLPYLDLPLQHVSKNQLKVMGRKGDFETYSKLINDIRRRLPMAVIRSTYLTGFPGETEQDYRQFLKFQEEVGFEWLGVFTYSREEGTRAYHMGGLIEPLFLKNKAKKRKEQVERRQLELTNKKMEKFIGQELIVLIEELIPDSSLAIGRTYLQAPEVDGSTVVHGDSFNIGDRIRCTVKKVNGFDLECVPL